MSEDRTAPPSKRRRQLARQHGQVPHSPEATAAAGWLAAVTLLGFLGDDLALGLAKLVHGSLTSTMPGMLIADRGAAIARVRELFIGLGWPFAAVLGSFMVGALVAHQVQVRGLWAPSLIVPAPRRLWAFSSEAGLALQTERVVWAIFKAFVLVVGACWAIRTAWFEILRLGSLETPSLVLGAGHIILKVSWLLGAVLLILGIIDFGLRYRRFESMLRTTSQEQREDQRVIDGDPAVRAQRRRAAQALRADSPEVLAGSTLILSGAAGLTLVLEGGPPPKRVTVRSAVKGPAGMRVRRSAEAKAIPQVEDHDLARKLARRPSARSSLAAALMDELNAVWPKG